MTDQVGDYHLSVGFQPLGETPHCAAITREAVQQHHLRSIPPSLNMEVHARRHRQLVHALTMFTKQRLSLRW